MEGFTNVMMDTLLGTPKLPKNGVKSFLPHKKKRKENSVIEVELLIIHYTEYYIGCDRQ